MKAMIVGGGFIARTHIEAIRSIGHEVSWISGRDAERTARFAEQNGIPHHTTDIDRALSGDADIVHICTPPYAHADIIRKCLASGKHVVCEKPLSLDPEEAAQLAAEADTYFQERGLVTALCFNVRYYPAVIEAARLMHERGQGKAMMISGSYLQEFHLPPHPDGWRFDPALSGGQRAVSEIGTHWIDLAHALTGNRITGVIAELDNWYPRRYRKNGMLTLDQDGEEVQVETEDTAAVIMRFDNGGLGTLFLSETSPGHPNDLSIEINDLHTSCEWHESEPDVLQLSDSGKMVRHTMPAVDRTDTFSELFREVYAAAEGREHGAYPAFSDGAYVSAVCSAIIESGRRREWVSVPDISAP